MAAKLEFDESSLFAEFDPKEQQKPTTKCVTNDISEQCTEDKRIEALKEENYLLRCALRKLVDSKSCVKQSQSESESSGLPFVQAIYFDNKESRDKRLKIENFIRHISTLECEKQDDETPEHIAEGFDDLQPSAYGLNSFVNERETERGSKYNGCSSKDDVLQNCDTLVINSVKYFDIFCIDYLGFPLVDFNPRVTDGWEIPVYDQVFFTALPCSEETRNVKVRFIKKCFNCDSTAHSLQNCPEPQNSAKINANRSKFTANQSPVFLPKSRYHGGLSARNFMNFKAGHISDKLREALSIKLDELPPYIYRMRELGYPPGYLPHNQQPDLLLYDADGNIDPYTGEDLDEHDASESPKQVFVEYPGLNVEVPEGVKDLRNPPMRPHQQLSNMMHIYRQTMDRAPHNSVQGNSSGHAKKRKRPELERDEKDMELDDGAAHDLSFEFGTPAEELHVRKKARYSSDRQQEGSYSPTHPTLEFGEAEKSLLKQYRHGTLHKHLDNSTPHSPPSKLPPLPSETPPRTPLPPPLPSQTPPFTPQQPGTPYPPPLPLETPPRTPALPPLPKGTAPITPNQSQIATAVSESQFGLSSYFVTPTSLGKGGKAGKHRRKKQDLEEGEIQSDEENAGEEEEDEEEEEEEEEEQEEKGEAGWWLNEPLVQCQSKPAKKLSPPPQPRIKLPMEALSRFYTSSTVLQKLSFEDRIMWLDPVYGNLQIVSGRYEKLKDILRKIPKKTSKR